MQSGLLMLCCIASALLTIKAQSLESPCPNVFKYEQRDRDAETDRWYGVIQLSTDVELHSVWVDVELDRPAHILGVSEHLKPEGIRVNGNVKRISPGMAVLVLTKTPIYPKLKNWYGEVTSSDNKIFTITNRRTILLPGPATPVRIFVKYAEIEQIPVVKSISMNGRIICPPSVNIQQLATLTEPSVNLQTGGIQTQGRKSTTSTTQRPLILQQISQNQQQIIQQQQQILEQQQQQQQHLNNNNRPNQQNNQNTVTNQQRPIVRPQGQVNPNAFNQGNQNTFEETTTRRQQSIGTNTEEDFDWLTIQKPSTAVDQDDAFQSELRPGRKPATNRPIQNSNPNKQNLDLTPTSQKSAQCGVVAVQARPLITHGQETKEGQWPWHAAIYRSSGIDLSYICGSSLISLNHVVTAAHCVARQKSIRPIDHESLQVYLGKYNLRVWTSEGIQVQSVDQILIHPEYNYTSFLNDVAVLKFRKTAEYTNYVRPVCLWRENSDINSVVGREGTVVGWGYDETGRVTNQLAMAKMPVVSQQTCIWSYPDFFPKFTSEKTYCAGFRNGTSVCNGDSGGGMVFPTPYTDPVVWELRGLVSVSVALQNEFICDSHHYVVFTDLAKHQQWLLSAMN